MAVFQNGMRLSTVIVFRIAVLVFAVPVFASEPLEEQLRLRVTADPNNAANWRMLGKVFERNGDSLAAEEALHRAAELDPQSAAAHYDLGSLLLKRQRVEDAIHHLALSVRLAPESDHGVAANTLLQQLNVDPQYTALVTFQAPWTAVPRPNDPVESRLVESPARSRWDWEVEGGVMFNSNVALAPISRQLSSSERSGFQSYIAPELEYLVLDTESWQFGAQLDTYFSVNEGHLTGFNLQHYQPGVYLDRRLPRGASEWVTRVDYKYTMDLFGGQTFGNRHAVTTSLTVFDERPVTSVVFWRGDYTNYLDDGVTPDVDSADGFVNTVGMSRCWEFEHRFWKSWEVGGDVQWARLRGSDQAYRGVYIYVEGRAACWLNCELIVTGGSGYREFPEFTGTPSRNEILYVGGLQLERPLSKNWSCTSFFNYDRFDSRNTNFSAERYTTGIYATWQR